MQQMQMAAMMQMQMCGMMGAAPMIPMMHAMPMATMVPMMPLAAPAAVPSCDQDEEQLGPCTHEDITATEQDIKDAEKHAKSAAKELGSYVGLMARYIEDEGFGFISCPECRELWDKTDIFVSGRNFVSSGIDVGDIVTF